MLRAALRGLIPALAFCALLAPWQVGAQQNTIEIDDPDCGPEADPAGCTYVNPALDKEGVKDVTGGEEITVTVSTVGYVLGGATGILVARGAGDEGHITVSNHGTVVQKGGSGAGIDLLKDDTSVGGDITVTNTGTIESSGSAAIRARSEGSLGGVTVMSSGTITATGLRENSSAIQAFIFHDDNVDKIDIDITDDGTVSSAAPNVGAVYADHHGEGNVEITVGEDAEITALRNVAISADMHKDDGRGSIDIDHAGRVEGESGIRARVRAAKTLASTDPVIAIDATGDVVARVPVGHLDADALAVRDGRTTGGALLHVARLGAELLTGIEDGTGIDARGIDPGDVMISAADGDRNVQATDRKALLDSYDLADGTNAVLSGVRDVVARYFGRLSDAPEMIDHDEDAMTPEVPFDFDDDAHLRAWLLDDANQEDLRGFLISTSEADTLIGNLADRKPAADTSAPHHTGDIVIAVGADAEGSKGLVDAVGHGVRALYARPHDLNGEIKVTVHEGARIVADKAGIFVSGAGRDGGTRRLKHAVQVDGTVWGGEDAVIRLGIGDYYANNYPTDANNYFSDLGIYSGSTRFSRETGTVTIGATGRLNAGADGRAIVGAAGTHVIYDAGDADTSKIVGDIDLSARAGRSRVTLTGNFRVTGDIMFDANDMEDFSLPDTLALNVDGGRSGFVFGDIRNVDTLAVMGAGMASVRNAEFTASELTVDASTLFVHGHLDLGGDGTVTVTNSGKIVFVDTDAKITAGANMVDLGTLDHDGDGNDPNPTPEVPVVYVAGGASVPDTGLGQLIVDRDGNTVVIQDVVVLRYDGEVPAYEADPVDESPRPKPPEDRCVVDPDSCDPCVVDPDSCDPCVVDPDSCDQKTEPPAVEPGDSGNGKKVLAVGGSLALLFAMFDLFPDADQEMIAEARPQRAVSPGIQAFAETPGPKSADERGIAYRIVALDGDAPTAAAGIAGRASGFETSLTMHPGGGFHAGVSVAPSVSLRTATDSVSGAQYGARFGWRSDDAFVAVGYSRADLDGNAAIRNLSGLGMLAGLQDLRHDRMSLSGGARIDLGGVWSALPSLSVFGGTLRQDSYTASSAVFRTRVPGLSQDYSGWKAGVSFAPRDPFEAGGLAWRPELNLATTRVASDSVGLGLVQKGPGLSFTTAARVARLPKNIHALGAGLSLGGRGNWRVRGGYIGMATDGEVDHAAVVRFGMKF